MQWPVEHPLRDDLALRVWADVAARLVRAHTSGAVRQVAVLRYVPSRRVTSLVTSDTATMIVKVYASPRARGNHRRLLTLADSPARAVTPSPVACDDAGHVQILQHVPGVVFDVLDDRSFVDAAHRVGDALARLHRSHATLDRAWTIDDELEALANDADDRLVEMIAALVDDPAFTTLSRTQLVPAHRDCHPKQAVLARDRAIRLIDFDDAAMAPAELDVGNFVAHLRYDALTGRRSAAITQHAINRFIAGYGVQLDEVVELWARLTMIRLAKLADARHHRPDWVDAIVSSLRASEPAVRT